MAKPETTSLRARLEAEIAGADAKVRGNALTASQLERAQPIGQACVALSNHRDRSWFDYDPDVDGEGNSIHAPSEILIPLP